MSIASAPITTPLEERAAAFDQVLQRYARDENGIICASICYEPVRSLQPGDIGAQPTLVDNVSCEDFYAYEDAGMATGAYLAAQSSRHRVTGDPVARQQADSAYDGIRFIYELGERGKRPGFFPKPYGAVLSNQISRDQYLFVMSGLAEYFSIADASKQAQILDMLEQMAGYWIDIDYRTSYFGLPANSHLNDYMGSLFLGIIGIAAQATKAPHLEREYDRLHHELQLGSRMPETLMGMFRRGETYDAATYFRQAENPIMMKAMAIDRIWDREPAHRQIWVDALRSFWEDDLRVSLDTETGLNHFIVGYDAKSGGLYLTEPGVIEELENPLSLPVLNWGGRRQHAGSTQTAFAAAIIADRLGASEARDVMYLILDKLSLKRFRGLTVPDERHIPPSHEFEQNLLNSAYLTYWLWTYWMARERSLVEARSLNRVKPPKHRSPFSNLPLS